jgi:predicted transcriptional regulator
MTGRLEEMMAETITLTRSERQRLARLAREADCAIDEILRDVLRDGFEYTEYKIKAVNEGLSDLADGRLLSLDELKGQIAGRRTQRGRIRRKAA